MESKHAEREQRSEDPHATSVRSLDGGLVLGYCTCGWSGPERMFMAAATQDVSDHLEAVGA